MSILGVGLLGGSLGLAIKRRITSCRVIGYAHRKVTLEAALASGAIDEGYADPLQAVRGSDLVILCTPVGVFEPMLRAIGPAVGNALVTDVGSTKRSIVQLAHAILPKSARFVGSHPMAGSEKRGVEFARADLCDNALCIVTPTPQTDSAALADVEGFWKALGMRLLRLSPADHDQRVAQISHLPHALAALVVEFVSLESMPLAGKGFFDLTRIAGGDGALWRDILVDNRDNMRECLTQFALRLKGLADLLEPGKEQELKAFLDAAASRRSGMLRDVQT